MEYFLVVVIVVLILWGLYVGVKRVYNEKPITPSTTVKKTKPIRRKKANKRPNKGN